VDFLGDLEPICLSICAGWPGVRGGAGAGAQGRQRALGGRQLGSGCPRRRWQGPFPLLIACLILIFFVYHITTIFLKCYFCGHSSVTGLVSSRSISLTGYLLANERFGWDKG
jgi:hypothetical protein